MIKISPLRKRQFIGGIIGVIVGAFTFYFLTLKSSEEYISLGPMNSGHTDLSCVTCHADAKGNLMQQVQSNFEHSVGARETGVFFGTQDVSVDNCLSCHDRPNDRHPTHRFSEPRFSDAIKVINATTCITCHTEHKGERITLSSLDINYCMNCHQDLEVEDDPLDISHKDLISKESWNTCIQCHDFHGNHTYEVPDKLRDTIPLQTIDAYLKGGDDPYGTNKKYIGLTELEWVEKINKE